VICSKKLSLIHYHEVTPHLKGIYIVKMSPYWLAVALFLSIVSVPGTLMATPGGGTDGNPNGPPPIVFPVPQSPDGNPNGPPPGVVIRLR
jgi:hypothetical protein